MSDEKTLDELKAELDSLKKANLEREMAKEKEKVEEAQKLEKEKEAEELKEQLLQEVMVELDGKSKITEEVEDSVEEKPRFETFMSDFKKKYGYGSKKYEDIAKEIASPGNFKGGRK